MNAPQPAGPTRRTVLTSSAALAGTALAGPSFAAPGRARGGETLRIALVGCGGRGRGAASQALSTSGQVRLVAMADAFEDQLDGAYKTLEEGFGNTGKLDVPVERRFAGFDAYEKAIDAGVDVVILATPPGFRPMHFEHAIRNDKHVFMEKPVATDAGGVRRVLATAEEARRKDLKVGVGLQRHHSAMYDETIRRIQDGAIGSVNLMRCYWTGGGVWVRQRQPGQTEMEYQMRNWYYFNWLCGDHIVEQHIHNLDVCNWLKGEPPVRAQGVGGRQVRTGIDHGEIFDHHMVEFTYRDGAVLLSECRHQPGCWGSVSEHAHGSQGTANISAGRIDMLAGDGWRFRGEDPNHYQVEHDALFDAIRTGKPYNEAVYGAHSTMTAIFGRMATYSGKVLDWDDCISSERSIMPTSFAWDATPPTVPGPDGRYPIPTPGVTEVI
jgi:predicted dehydrogenase